jgi:hypothetical protein
VTGTEGGRSGLGYWPIWHVVSWDFNSRDGTIKSAIDFSGVVDWGKAYAFHLFESKNRQLLVGWAYVRIFPVFSMQPKRAHQRP